MAHYLGRSLGPLIVGNPHVLLQPKTACRGVLETLEGEIPDSRLELQKRLAGHGALQLALTSTGACEGM